MMNADSSQSSQPDLTPQQHEAVETALTQSHASNKRVGLDAVVLKRSGTFLVSDRGGDILPERNAGLGLFRDDTRFLSLYELTLNGRSPVFLSNEQHVGERILHDLENDELPAHGQGPHIPAHTLALHRERRADERGITEHIRVTSFGMQPAKVRLSLRFAADFADLMAIRGKGKLTPGHSLEPRIEGRCAVRLLFLGADGCTRYTQLAFSPLATHLDDRCAQFDLHLSRGQTESIIVVMTVGEDSNGSDALDIADAQSEDEHGWLERAARVTGHPVLRNVICRGLLDLELLRTRHPDGSHYIAGGVPWFVTLFGRDSVWSALEVCGYQSRIAGQTLRLLAKYQATAPDAYHGAQPGKILHEMRCGQLARLGRIPQSPIYYGSVDSTPLFLILLSEYVCWTGDLQLARDLRPQLERALEWIDRYGDSDGDGYLDYGGRYPHGLVNQGWKDSGDAIVDEDGSLATPPIALVEVQGYLYRAWRSTGKLLGHLGDEAAATALAAKAAALRERFERAFWSDELGCYVLALQQGGRPAKVVTSNAGQVLWSGLASVEHAARVAQRLMEEDLFSGWGVRTLSSKELRYNPLSYHLGSVWPHDNAIILRGLLRYGHKEAALRIFDGLFSAACGFPDHRMPELYCGFPRRAQDRHPARYPVACNPQAWAAGALPYALIGFLGLRARALAGCLYICRPCLPEWLDGLSLRGVCVGQARVDLAFERHGTRIDVDVERQSGDLRIERVADDAPQQ